MTILTFLWRFTIGGAWKWLAAGAGLIGVYLKIRSGDKAKDKLQDAKETIKAHEVRNEVENRIARERDARERLRSDWQE